MIGKVNARGWKQRMQDMKLKIAISLKWFRFRV